MTSFQRLTLLLAVWSGSVLGLEATPTSPCDSDSFEVQFRAVCPTNPGDLPITYEEATRPTLVIRVDEERRPNSEAVFASFGPNPYAAVEGIATLFSMSVNDPAIFAANGRQKVQLSYSSRVKTGFKNLVFTVCDDSKGKCDSRDKKILTAKEMRFSACNIPPLVVLPVYAGCR